MTESNSQRAEISATADKLYRAADGFPGLELLSTQIGPYAVRAEIDDAMLIVGIKRPTQINVRIYNATPALALTIVDAVKAYGRLNGLLVCRTCGHRQHSPLLCTEILEDSGSLCSCAAKVPEFDVIGGDGQ